MTGCESNDGPLSLQRCRAEEVLTFSGRPLQTELRTAIIDFVPPQTHSEVRCRVLPNATAELVRCQLSDVRPDNSYITPSEVYSMRYRTQPE